MQLIKEMEDPLYQVIHLDLDHRHIETPPCPVFSSPSSPAHSLGSHDETNALLLDCDDILQLCLQNASTDQTTLLGNDILDPLAMFDNPMLDNFSDLSTILDPTSLPFPFPAPSEIVPSAEILCVDSPFSCTSSSNVATPVSSVSEELTSDRKRKLSPSDADSTSVSSKEVKLVKRRQKNNVASQVSRAKRKSRVANLFAREKELEIENARLREKVEEMTREAQKLTSLLVNRLTQ